MFTYIIKDKLSGFYKIGKTTNIEKRFSTLSTSNLNLEIVLVINNNYEKFLHKLYSNCKVEKEWYCLSFEDLKDIYNFKEELEIEEIKYN